tara:strand:+ start:41 stop:805 length:765 start_codon:yes stop_codon:yes gene_type:complete
VPSKELIKKLVKYGKSFDNGAVNILIHLSSISYESLEVENIKKKLDSLFPKAKASFYSITYQDLVDQLTSLKEAYPHEHHLVRLHDHFDKYCDNMNLKPKSQHVLRVMACGQSLALNFKYQFYFDDVSRGYRNFDYLGIYGNKSVRGLGRIENIIDADYMEESDTLVVKYSKYDVTDSQKKRLTVALKESLECGWKISHNHKFFLLKDFHELDYRKISKRGLIRTKFFDLEEILDPVPQDMQLLCEELSKKTWE